MNDSSIQNDKFSDLVDIGHLTAPLAIQAAQIDETPDPRVQFGVLVHLFENVLRIAAGVAIGSLRSELNVAPDRLAQVLLDGMRNPTYETWRLIAQQGASDIGIQGLIPSMHDDLETIAPLADEVRRRRNDAAHALPGDAWIETTFASLKPRVATALRSLPWLYKLELHARLPDGRRIPLHGDAVDLGTTNLDDVLVEGFVSGRYVDLFPFVVLVPRGSQQCLAVCRSLAGWDCVEFYGLGSAGTLGKTKAKKQLQKFAAWCRYHERRRLLGDSGPLGDITAGQKLYGRAAELQEISESVQQHRVTWVEGIAGIGKSLLVDHVARDGRLRARARVWPWRCRLNEPRPVLALYKYLVEKLGPDGHLAPRGLADDPAVWLRYLRSLLLEFGGPEQETVVVLEGLDEAGDDAFAEVPFEVTAPTVRWLCSGRPTEKLLATYTEDRCQRIRIKELTPSAVRAWLIAEAPALEPFAASIEAACGGLPVYLRTIIMDLAAGRYRPGDPLPPASRLREFWQDAINRAMSQSPAVGRLCLDVLEIAAHSIASLTPLVLRGILTSAGTLVADDDGPDDDLEQAIEATSSLLLRDETAHSEIVLRLAHATLTELLRTDPQFRNARHFATKALVDFVQTTDSEPMISHTSRFGVRQLLALKRDEDAFRLLGEFRWICARLFSSADIGARRRRLAELQADLDAVPHAGVHPELDELREFLANHVVPIAEFGFGFFYQACANADAGAYWKERGAIGWAARKGAAFRSLWLEKVSVYSEHTIARAWLELVVPDLPTIGESKADVQHQMSGAVRSLAFEPNGRYLLTTHWSGRTLRWDLRTGSWAPVDGVDGAIVGFQSDDEFWLHKLSSVELWKQQRGEQSQYQRVNVHALPGHFRAAWRNEAGRYVAACQDGSWLQLVRLDDGEVLCDARLHAEGVDVSPESGLGIIVGPDRFLVGNEWAGLGHSEIPADFGFLQMAVADGRVTRFANTGTFAISERRRAIYRIGLWHRNLDEFDLDTLDLRTSIPIAHADVLPLHAGTSAGPENDTLVFALNNGGLVICDIQRGIASATAPVHLGSFRAALTRGAEHVATTDRDVIRLWSVEALVKTAPYKVPDELEAVIMLSIPEGGDRVACVHHHGDLRILDFSTGKLVHKDSGFAAPSGSSRETRSAEEFFALSGDGRRLAGLAGWYGLTVMEIATTQERTISFGGDDEEYDPSCLSSLSLNWDGSVVVMSHGEYLEGEQVAWDVETGMRVDVPDMEPKQHPSRYTVEFVGRVARFRDLLNKTEVVWWADANIDCATIASDGRAAVACEDGSVTTLRVREGGVPGGIRLVRA